jgi:hypothetical protein
MQEQSYPDMLRDAIHKDEHSHHPVAQAALVKYLAEEVDGKRRLSEVIEQGLMKYDELLRWASMFEPFKALLVNDLLLLFQKYQDIKPKNLKEQSLHSKMFNDLVGLYGANVVLGCLPVEERYIGIVINTLNFTPPLTNKKPSISDTALKKAEDILKLNRDSPSNPGFFSNVILNKVLLMHQDAHTKDLQERRGLRRK